MGYAEGNVLSNGDIAICNKAPSFIIGNVDYGDWYFDKIAEFNESIHDFHECSNCIAQRSCTLCFEKLHLGADGKIEDRTEYCEFIKMRLKLIFNHMLEICDNNPGLWNEANRLIIEKKEKLLAVK